MNVKIQFFSFRSHGDYGDYFGDWTSKIISLHPASKSLKTLKNKYY